MFQGARGPCTCVFCSTGRKHPVHRGLGGEVLGEWGDRGHLLVAESLDPKDILRTRICSLCAHEEIV